MNRRAHDGLTDPGKLEACPCLGRLPPAGFLPLGYGNWPLACSLDLSERGEGKVGRGFERFEGFSLSVEEGSGSGSFGGFPFWV